MFLDGAVQTGVTRDDFMSVFHWLEEEGAINYDTLKDVLMEKYS